MRGVEWQKDAKGRVFTGADAVVVPGGFPAESGHTRTAYACAFLKDGESFEIVCRTGDGGEQVMASGVAKVEGPGKDCGVQVRVRADSQSQAPAEPVAEPVEV